MKINFFKKKDKKEKKSKKEILKSKEKTIKEKLKASKRKTKIIAIALVLSILSNLSLGIYQHHQIELRQEEINARQLEIEEINGEMDSLTEKLKEGEIKESEYEEKIKTLEEEKNELNEKLQAKINSARSSDNVAAASVSTVAVSGSCTDWIVQAGVTDVANAYTLIMRESGCRVNATNSSSGAYGIPQALPGSKMASAGSDWQTNPVTQIRWMNSYVLNRYGSWANAVAFWNQNHWY